MLKSYSKHACKFTIFMFLYAICCATNTSEHVVCMYYERLLERTGGVGRGVDRVVITNNCVSLPYDL